MDAEIEFKRHITNMMDIDPKTTLSGMIGVIRIQEYRAKVKHIKFGELDLPDALRLLLELTDIMEIDHE